MSTVAGISAAYPPAAHGQAIVTYGVSVGRAAGAGAAAGTGAAGILDKLGRTTADAASHEAKGKPGVKANPEPVRKPASPNAITIGGNKSAGAVEETGTMRTASGISIAGLAGSTRGSAESENAAAEAGEVPASAAPSDPASPLGEPEGFRLPEVPLPEPAPIAAAAQRRAATPAPAPAIAQGIAPKPAVSPTVRTSDADSSTITAGMPIEEVIKLLGQPLMRLSGVEGSEYDERYVFLAASGSKLTILARDGLVVAVSAD